MTTLTDRLDHPIWQSVKKARAERETLVETNEPANATIGSAADLDLTQAAAKSDLAAFEEIYNRHHRRVYAICLRMTRNTTEAEDLTQEVFMQLYRKIGSFRGDSAFSTWLHRLTVNQVLMHFRKRDVKFEKTTEQGEPPVQIALGTENPKRMSIVDKICPARCHRTASAWLPKCFRAA